MLNKIKQDLLDYLAEGGSLDCRTEGLAACPSTAAQPSHDPGVCVCACVRCACECPCVLPQGRESRERRVSRF